MHCPGGKGQFYQKFINLMPPHEVYIESHLGGGAIMRNKRFAKINIGIEIDPKIINKWRNEEQVDFELVHGDAVDYLKKYKFVGTEMIYCDPPYLRETRRSSKKIYSYDYTHEQHCQLLDLIKALPCKVMISGYKSSLYERELKNWYVQSFDAIIRKRKSTEYIWMNYAPPIQLHDYSNLGSNYRERERIKITMKRWKTRFKSMPLLKQQAILSALQTVNS